MLVVSGAWSCFDGSSVDHVLCWSEVARASFCDRNSSLRVYSHRRVCLLSRHLRTKLALLKFASKARTCMGESLTGERPPPLRALLVLEAGGTSKILLSHVAYFTDRRTIYSVGLVVLQQGADTFKSSL